MDVIRKSMLEAADNVQLPDDLEFAEISQELTGGHNPQTFETYIEEYMYHLPENYRMLAWQIAQCHSDSAEQVLGKDRKAKQEALITGPSSASTAGIFAMVRAAYMLPYVYAAQRGPARENMGIEAQAKELAEIAKGSIDYLELFARQAIPVSGVLERNFYFRETFTRNPVSEYEIYNHAFALTDTDGCLKFGLKRTDIESIIQAISASYERDTGKAPRNIGCLALKVSGADGMSVFEKTWISILDYCASNPGFYQETLSGIDAIVKEYGLTSTRQARLVW